MRSSLDSHFDTSIVDPDRRGNINKGAEKVAGLRDSKTIADLRAEKSVQLLAISVN